MKYFIAEKSKSKASSKLSIQNVLEEAFELKMSRHNNGLIFLQKAKLDQLFNKFTNKIINPPSRSWLNDFSSKQGFKFHFSIQIEKACIFGCLESVITTFYNQYKTLIESFEPWQIFESIVVLSSRKKAKRTYFFD